MRAFSSLFIVILLLGYILTGLISYFALKNLSHGFPRKTKIFINLIYLGYSALILLGFIILYFSPSYPGKVIHYPLYLTFNVVLIADILVKSIVALFSIPYYILKLFKKRIMPILIAGCILSLGVSLSMACGFFIGKTQLMVNRVEVRFASLPKSFDGFTIAQISDLHTGSFLNKNFLKKVVREVNIIAPDIIIFTGDLVNNFAEETKDWQPVFSGLSAKMGKFAILGNHDYGDYSIWKDKKDKQNNFQSVIKAYDEFGLHLLRNESTVIKGLRDSIFLIGVENWGHRPFPQYANLDSALKDIPQHSFKILMTHDPSHWESKVVGQKEIPLTFSGHTHGFQWGLKPGGIEFSIIYFLRKKWAGLYSDNEQYLYVNRGLGTIGVNFRLDMPPEITLFTLKRI